MSWKRSKHGVEVTSDSEGVDCWWIGCQGRVTVFRMDFKYFVRLLRSSRPLDVWFVVPPRNQPWSSSIKDENMTCPWEGCLRKPACLLSSIDPNTA